MSYADDVFIKNVPGYLGKRGQVRKVKRFVLYGRMELRHIRSRKFGVVNRYDLSKRISGTDTSKNSNQKAVRMSFCGSGSRNRIISNDLHSHIWDSWADENGSIGKAYGISDGRKASV